MGLYEVPFSMPWLGVGMGIMLANFHMCGTMVVQFSTCAEKCESKRTYVL